MLELIFGAMFSGTIMYTFTDSEDYSFGKWVGFCWLGMFPWVFCFVLWTIVSPTLIVILVVVVFVFALIVDGGRRTKEIQAERSYQASLKADQDERLKLIAADRAKRDHYKAEKISSVIEDNYSAKAAAEANRGRVELDEKVQLLHESKLDFLNQKIKEEKSATSKFTRVGLFICVGCIVILYLGLVESYGVLFTIIIAVLIVTLVITALKNFMSEAKIDGIERDRKKLENPKFHRFTRVVGNIILPILVFGFLVWLIDAQ